MVAAVAIAATDTDADGVADSADNCVNAANPDQLDSDGDGFGNACDADYDNNGAVDGADLAILQGAFGFAWDEDGFVAVADHDGNGTIDGADYLAFGRMNGGAPGPSGLACAGQTPCP